MKSKLTALLAATVLLLCGCSGETNSAVQSDSGTAEQSAQTETSAPLEVSPMTMHFLKVGKADAIVLQLENHAVIIDCGEKTDGDKVADCLDANGITSIDYMILTHYDQDHIGGASKVINHYDVQNVIASDYEEDSKEYEKLIKAMDEKGLSFTLPEEPLTFTLDNTIFTVYPHEAENYADGFDNNCSLVIRVVHGSNVMLFTGDAMQERLKELMDIGDCDLLKVPYHGREIANLPEFLDAVTPEYGVICTSKSELSDVTVSELEDRNITYYATCLDGNITAVSDGESFTFTTSGVE